VLRTVNAPRQDFKAFLEWCVDTIGARKSSAEGYFRHAGLSIKELIKVNYVIFYPI